ncbi:MAG: exo-alpha-sialidase, partial [Anaerolineales bacterium]|nr:exo-alpha-sialidase [Anaerolineales bacterium]
KTWSDPLPFFLTLSNTLWPSHLQIHVDSDSNLHAVWSVGDVTGNGLAVYYANLAANNITWTEPIVLAEAIGFEADTPSIIEYNDELFVIYHNDGPPTRWMRRSSDGGRTWSEPVRLFQHIGTNGAAAIIIDSNGTMHMFFGNRVGGATIIHGMWHSTWLGNKWSIPVPIISGSKGDDFDPSFANAIVSQGNSILVAWHQDPQARNSRGASFSYLILDAPEIPVVSLPTAQTQSEVIPVGTNVQLNIVPTLTPQAGEKIYDFGDLQIINQSDLSRISLVGLIPAILLIFVFLLYKLRTR